MNKDELKERIYNLIDQIEDLDVLLDYYLEFNKIIKRTENKVENQQKELKPF